MADGIQISTQVLIDTASKVRNHNNTLDTKLADINKSMNDLEATWKSDAATEISLSNSIHTADGHAPSAERKKEKRYGS